MVRYRVNNGCQEFLLNYKRFIREREESMGGGLLRDTTVLEGGVIET
jgi:hypothetical protein